jgi:acetylornithine deacetylase/succinyl-diaminopimelate desuccinylase-like protein
MNPAPFSTHSPDTMLDEAIQHLRAYLRMDTTNPPGSETTAAQYFLEILKKEGIEAELREAMPGRGSLVARIPGDRSASGPLVLLHHADVVAANQEEWTQDPFAASIHDGYLYGRGALDMKSVGILHLMSMLKLHREKVPLRRDLIWLLVADEETGGRLGTGRLIQDLPWLETASLVLDEGGVVLPRSPQEGGDLYCVSVAEKIPVHLLLHARGEAGHGSIPGPGTAPERILTALNRILNTAATPRVHPVVQAFFTGMAATMPSSEASPFTRIEQSLQDPSTRREILRDPMYSALLHDTVTCTFLQAGEKINVIPSKATAGIDCRLLPDRSADTFLEQVAHLVEDLDIQLEPLMQESGSGVSPLSGEFMEAMTSCVREEAQRGTVLPCLMTGAADGRYFRRRGIPTYGFAPFRLSRREIARMHGVDERISLENMSFGLNFFSRLLFKLMCNEPIREE